MDLKKKIIEDLTEEQLEQIRREETSDLSREEVREMMYSDKKTHKRNPFIEEKILGWLAEGKTKKQAAELSGITEQTLYNWIKGDPIFKERVENNLGGKIQLLAVDNVASAVRDGDVEVSKWILGKTRYFEKRYDPKLQDPSIAAHYEQNALTGKLEVIVPHSIPNALLGDDYIPDEEKEYDDLEQALYEQDDSLG